MLLRLFCLLILPIFFMSPALSKDVDWIKSHPYNVIGKENLDKPVLMYFYYDGCLWCDVQQEKTWSNPDTFKFINENFYAVKVDRYKYGEVVSHYDVSLYPTIVLGRKDNSVRKIDYIKGFKNPEQLKEILKRFLKNP